MKRYTALPGKHKTLSSNPSTKFKTGLTPQLYHHSLLHGFGKDTKILLSLRVLLDDIFNFRKVDQYKERQKEGRERAISVETKQVVC
jgi:hypothetical protein